jgi:hypothetical protein
MPDIKNPLKGGNRVTWVIGGVTLVGVGVYVWWRKKNAAAAVPTSSGYGYGTYAGYGYGVSPIFGSGAGGLGSPFGSYGYQPAPGPQPITTNGQWAAAVETSLSVQGYNPLTISAALGKYLTGQTVTQDQADLISVALAFQGDPPVPSPTGFPPGVHVGGSGGGGNAKNPVTGLHQTQVGVTGADIAWSGASGATSYQVTSSKGNVSMTGRTSARIHNINTGRDRGDQATVRVLAEPAGTGAIPATIVVHTKR